MKIRSVFLFAMVLNLTAITSGWTVTSDSKGRITITTNSEAAKADYLKGLEMADKLRLPDSLEHFRKATQEDPNFALAYLNLAFAEPVAEDFFKDLKHAVAASSKASEAER